MLDIILRCLICVLSMVGFVSVALLAEIYALPTMKEIAIRIKGIFCKHEYVKKLTWKVFEHEYSKLRECQEIEVQCRKCGKKKIIKFYEDDE